jgi:hypothetical protein
VAIWPYKYQIVLIIVMPAIESQDRHARRISAEFPRKSFVVED